MKNTNEENTRRLAELDSQKLTIEQENTEKVEELQLQLKQTQESSTKLRKALHKMKETITNNDQTRTQESGIFL